MIVILPFLFFFFLLPLNALNLELKFYQSVLRYALVSLGNREFLLRWKHCVINHDSFNMDEEKKHR